MSQTYISAAIAILVQVLPWIGVRLPSDQLTIAVQTIVTIGAAIWVIVRRYQRGDITLAGVRKV